ncbi:hypothetical protein [Rhodococcus sp. NCIMB 12038]|uniref:hypothetical protein n=1 Tax=Rhodococcus sp. NCIMB 12038 TaxID=933800 RepID=UPI000B3D0C75|nr:hypothetical protein [Rhodococcus sp. NCIMB 12038]OUS97419.1 hypothetical protein CA951_03500 [Rhodococcus sp. NCIMB 12038]
MSRTSDTPTPSLRRDLLVILGLLGLAVLVFRVGHIPGVVNTATLIAAGASIWAGWRLVTVLRRAHVRATALVRARLAAPPHRAPARPVALHGHRNR